MSNHLACASIERDEGRPLRLVLRGDVNIYAAALLHELALTLLQEQEDVVVSCEELACVDASALQVLLALAQDFRSRGRSVRLAGVSAELEGLLQLAGVKNAFFPPAAVQGN